MNRKIGVTEAIEKFSELVEQVQYRGFSFVISRHGKPAAALVPMEVYENWQRQLTNFFDAIQKIREANPDADPDEVMRDVLAAQQSLRSTPSG
ncbi:MAG: type II toxin-antitoxin system Phd/YefM family antitoxin [Anaerolineales bacterium]|nr:type II toxin-antitoxin system Phd/YefM family antitoxin [Anaerolineales bacterium]